MTRGRWLVACLVLVVAAFVVVRLAAGSSDDDATATRPDARPSASPSASPSRASEIAPVDTQTTAPGSTVSPGLPGQAATEVPLVVTLPPAASTTGGLAPGYPKRLVPVVPGAQVRSSSVSPSKGRLQVALVAGTTATPDDVLRFYAVRLARFGFVSTPAPTLGGSVAAAYTRGGSHLVVTVPTTGGGVRDYSVLATLRTKTS